MLTIIGNNDSYVTYGRLNRTGRTKLAIRVERKLGQCGLMYVVLILI